MTSREVRMVGLFGWETHPALVVGDHLGVVYLQAQLVVDANTREMKRTPTGFCVVHMATGVLLSHPMPSIYEATCLANSLGQDVVDWRTFHKDPVDTQKRLRAWFQHWTRAGGWLGQPVEMFG